MIFVTIYFTISIKSEHHSNIYDTKTYANVSARFNNNVIMSNLKRTNHRRIVCLYTFHVPKSRVSKHIELNNSVLNFIGLSYFTTDTFLMELKKPLWGDSTRKSMD